MLFKRNLFILNPSTKAIEGKHIFELTQVLFLLWTTETPTTGLFFSRNKLVLLVQWLSDTGPGITESKLILLATGQPSKLKVTEGDFTWKAQF